MIQLKFHFRSSMFLIERMLEMHAVQLPSGILAKIRPSLGSEVAEGSDEVKMGNCSSLHCSVFHSSPMITTVVAFSLLFSSEPLFPFSQAVHPGPSGRRKEILGFRSSSGSSE